jgi:uroporphyrinogen decarboxylase
MKRIVAALPREQPGGRVPVILFTKGGGPWLDALAGSGADAIGLDWTVDPAHARRVVGGRCALQGNLDPTILAAGEEAIRKAAAATLAAFDSPRTPGHVFNLGHGIAQTTPPDAVAVLVDAVHAHR